MRRWIGWGIVCLTWAAVVAAQQPPESAPAPCSAPEHRQFDFWIGTWRVETPDGRFAGTNEISRAMGDCVIHESWTGARGMVGQSFNIWDAPSRRWHQTWVDSTGMLLLLDGGFRDGSMRLEGEARQPDGSPVRHRITWTPLAREDCPKCVRQLWEQSTDGGASWSTLFDGIYRPAAAE